MIERHALAWYVENADLAHTSRFARFVVRGIALFVVIVFAG